MQAGFKIFEWNETTGDASFYLQGDLILSLNLPTYIEAHKIHRALESTYKKGVDDGLTWVTESIGRYSHER